MRAVKLSKTAQEKALRKCRRQNSKKGNVKPETLEPARYIMVFTTLDRSIPAETIPECVWVPWQLEPIFKRSAYQPVSPRQRGEQWRLME